MVDLFAADGFLEVGKYRIHYARWGEKGGRIVILHSMGMDAYSMEKLCGSLSGKYRVLALTILAHGDSTVPTEQVTLPEHAELLRTCYKQLGYTPCVLIGHSIGGRMGMILAADHPDEVKGLLLIDIAPPDPVSRPWSQQAPESLKDEAEAAAYLRQRYPGFAAEYIESRLRHGFIRMPDNSLKPKPTGSPAMTSYFGPLAIRREDKSPGEAGARLREPPGHSGKEGADGEADTRPRGLHCQGGEPHGPPGQASGVREGGLLLPREAQVVDKSSSG